MFLRTSFTVAEIEDGLVTTDKGDRFTLSLPNNHAGHAGPAVGDRLTVTAPKGP
jgi:hypothetical protein